MTRVERQILKNQIIIMKGICMNFKDYHNEHNQILLDNIHQSQALLDDPRYKEEKGK